ncbi:hypothetical protein [Streptomyces sp. NBC_00566]|uniref:hypothetical protein n=1 Tax=Streptomyces sp. NBC_00566 TaxID=2975778 RepID=UPI002E80841A|nr:hypothetical protein [Streptomyces sp. NBC_00566]WUB90136.1 hypothetical protein OG812_27580 [Streptomyces sp. NBC_00566]
MTSIKPIAADILRGALLLPTSVARSGAVLAGRRTGRSRELLHAVLGIPLGALSLVAVGLELLFVARGVLYGLVDHGPYDHSWGGPTRGGAWLAHFAVGLPVAVGGLALLWCVASLHDRLGARVVRGERTGVWVPPVALLACAAGAVFVVAWVHQL